MSFRFSKCVNLLLVLTISTLPVLAQDHVVSPAELHQKARAAAIERQSRVDRLQKFFSSEPGRKALEASRIDLAQVRLAVPLLSDTELARLSAQADKVRTDFAAGSLSNQELTYIVIALGTAVLILVIVAAR